MQGHCSEDSSGLSLSAESADANRSCCGAAVNRVFNLAGMDLAASKMTSRMFSSFEQTCPPKEVKPWELNLFGS